MSDKRQYVYVLDTDYFYGENMAPEKAIRRMEVERIGLRLVGLRVKSGDLVITKKVAHQYLQHLRKQGLPE